MPSYGGAHGPDGSKKSGDQGQGSRDSKGGNTGGAKGQEGSGFGGAKFGGGRPSAKTSQMNSLANAIAGKNPMANQRAAQVDSFVSGANGWGGTDFAKAVRDYQDQGAWNKALDLFTGIREVNPFNSWNGTPNASWGFDPLGAVLGAAGLATGFPIGAAYGIAKKVSGWSGPQMAFNGQPTAYAGGTSMGSLFGGGGSYGGSNGVQTASGSQIAGQGGYGGGTGNNQGGYSPFRPPHTTGNPNVQKPLGGIPQTNWQQQPAQNLWAKPWPGQGQSQSYSPFGPGSWSGWG